MAPSQHAYNDPAYTGQAPNMYLTNVGRQQMSDVRHVPFTSVNGQFVLQGPGTLSSRSTEFSEEGIDSPHMSNVSWDEFAATQWEEDARLLEQQGHTQHAMQIPQNMLRFPTAPTSAGFTTSEHGIPATSLPMNGHIGLNNSVSMPVTPLPEMMAVEAFTSPTGPAHLVSDTISPSSPAHSQLIGAQVRHRHMQSSPSPSQTPETPNIPRRKSAPTQSKNGSASSNKVSKSPKPGPSQAPANSRSAHSAIERKYRENINSKIMELHKVLCSAAGPIFPDDQNEAGGYPYARSQRPDCDDEIDAASLAGQTTLPAKKADVLAGAVSYVKRSEREKRLLQHQLNEATSHFTAASERLQQYEQAHAMAQARARHMSGR